MEEENWEGLNWDSIIYGGKKLGKGLLRGGGAYFKEGGGGGWGLGMYVEKRAVPFNGKGGRKRGKNKSLGKGFGGLEKHNGHSAQVADLVFCQQRQGGVQT